MKRTMSLVLAMLMLTSILAAWNPIELRNEELVDDASGRADYEVVLIGAMEPRASSTDMNGNVRNALDVGDEINFRVVVQNTGDNDVSEITISLQVDGSVEGMPALVDVEDSAVCDDALICDHTTLASGDYLDGGNYHVRDSMGSNVVWTPATPGVYTVTISIDSGDQDTDLTNNQISYDVTVVDWYDISVDLEWDDGSDGQGTGFNYFTLTAMVDGSSAWDARDVELSLTFGGSFELADGGGNAVSMFDNDGDGSQSGCPTAVHAECTFDITFGEMKGAGQAEDIEIYANLSSDPPVFITAGDNNTTRLVPIFQQEYTFGGSIKGDANAASGAGAYTVTASLEQYTIYNQISTDYGAGGPGGGGTGGGTHSGDPPVDEMVESTVSLDDRNGNNDDLLTGSFASYDDVRVVSLTAGLDRASDGRMDAGVTRLYASVQHSGSSPETVWYDWNVEFTVDGGDGNAQTYPANECDDADIGGETYGHGLLGLQPPAQPHGEACTDVMLDPGVYAISATITLIDSTLTDSDPGNDCTPTVDCKEDMNAANDRRTGHFEIVNYGPFVYMTMDEITGALVQGSSVSFSARALHQNQPDMDGDGEADAMGYTWSMIGNGDGMEDPQLMGCLMSTICTIVVNELWAGSPTIVVTVTDHWNFPATASTTLTVWNQYTTDNGGNSAGDCGAVSYDLIYKSALPTMVNFTDAASGAVIDATLPGSSASWSSVCTFDLESQAQMDPNDVYSEDLTVEVDGDPAEGYSLWYEGALGWTELAGATQSQVDGDTVSLAWANDGSLPSRSSTRYAVFASASLGQAPQVGVSGLSATLSAGGVVTLNWGLENAELQASNDFGAIYINDDGDALDGTRNTFPLSQGTWEIPGTHGTTYNYLVRVENGETGGDGSTLFGTPVDSGSATADGQVDPAPGSSDVAAAKDGANITFSWTATDSSDVDHWKICWSQASAHTALEVTSNIIGSGSCHTTDDSTTSASMARHVGAGTYHYSVSAIDANGNVDASDSTDALEFTSDSGTLPGSGDTVGDDPADESIPQQAWIAIALLVLVAVIAGAFILTRGGVEGGDDEFDY